jgi:hypothetical protein
VKKQILLGHIGTLLLGGLIYILFRTPTLKMFDWYDSIGLSTSLNTLRHYASPVVNHIPNWFLYSLPDGLWIFSYISLMLFIWRNSVSFKNIFWILIIPTLAISSEIGQLFGLVSGTFDFADLLLYILGMILPFLFFTKSINLNFKLQTL